jgi:hypothetical protein
MRHRLQVVLANSVLLLVLPQSASVAQDPPHAPSAPSTSRPAAPTELRVIERAIQLMVKPEVLTIANVHAPAINCVFDTTCRVTVTDSVGDIPMPSDVTGTGRVQSRTFAAAAGSPGAGKTAYEYRVDMTQAVSAGEVPCVTDLTVEFGAIAKLQYDGSGPLDDGYVVVQGGIGTIGILEAIKTGNSITFTFNQPVCAGPTPGSGHSSYFFGLASASAPKAVTAKVGWPGLLPLDVHARAPN